MEEHTLPSSVNALYVLPQITQPLLFFYCLECVGRKYNCGVSVFRDALIIMQLPCEVIECVVCGIHAVG